MPLFSRTPANAEPQPPPVVEEPRRHNTLFSRRRSPSPPLDSHSPTSRSSLSHDRHNHNHNHTKNHSGGLLHRNAEDPSIVQARERVIAAENAEREADRALKTAKIAVREAREHAKRLEMEAAEDARLARLKVGQAKSISKGVGRLGRHDHV